MTNCGGPARRMCGRWSIWAVAAWLVVGLRRQFRGGCGISGDPEVIGVRIGFDGRYKLGRWTALEIAVRGGDQATLGFLSVVVPDGDDTPSQYATPESRPLQLVPGQTTRSVLYIKPGRDLDKLTVRFTPLDRGDPVEATFESNSSRQPDRLGWALEERQKLYVIVGPPIGLAWPMGLKMDEQVVLTDTSQLPTRWYGYDAVDVLVFSTSQAETFRQLREDSLQLRALEDWLKMGGRLVLAVGAEARECAGKGLVAARAFCPGKADRRRNAQARRGFGEVRRRETTHSLHRARREPGNAGRATRASTGSRAGRGGRSAAGGSHAARFRRDHVRGLRPRSPADRRLEAARRSGPRTSGPQA